MSSSVDIGRFRVGTRLQAPRPHINHTMAPPLLRRPPSLIVVIIIVASSVISSCALASPPRLSTAIIASNNANTKTSTSRLYVKSYKAGTIEGPPLSSKPDYSSIHGPFGSLLDRYLTILFRDRLASRLRHTRTSSEIPIPDSQLPYDDFEGIIDITHSMNSLYSNRTVVQTLAQDVLISLFPPFILDRFPSWFAKPFPVFSSKMCAYATVAFGTWLMGECAVNDIPFASQGVLVKRCRFLEESQCASVCVNSCKVPTQVRIITYTI